MIHSQNPTLPARSRGRLASRLASAFAVSLVAASLVLPGAPASAAEVPNAITAVKTDKTSYGYNERITLTFEWSVPDSTVAGDSFRLALPVELKALSKAKFPLRSPEGDVVANAEWDGSSVVFTLTDFVDSHDNVGGSGFLTVQWDHKQVPDTSTPIILVFEGNAVEVVIGDKPAPHVPCTTNCPPPAPTRVTRPLWKAGGWSDGSFEGTRDEMSNINWLIELPGSPTGFTGPITIVDTPSAGSVVECATIQIKTQITLESSAVKTVVDPSRYSFSCSESSFTLILDRIAPDEFVTLNYKGTITNQLSGTYGNRVEVTIGTGETGIKDTVIQRTAAGGVGGGVQSVSVGDYVWLDTNRDGIQDADEIGIEGVTLLVTGPGGSKVLDIKGVQVGPTVTDEHGLYSFDKLPVLPAGQHYTVTIDQEASAEALKDLLPTLPSAGSDRAVDSSTSSAESTDLTTNGARDETLDFGFVTYQLPTLPFPEEPTVPETPAVPAAAQGTLAYTGTESAAPLLLGALAFLLLGAASIVLVRVRRNQMI